MDNRPPEFMEGSWLRSRELIPLLSGPDDIEAASDWSRHVPFLYWIILALKPRRILHIGSKRAVVYAALCHAVKRLGNEVSCFSVSPLLSFEDPAESAFERRHAARYGSFSALLRGEKPEVSSQIGDAIDLMILDTNDPEQEPWKAYETWADFLSDRAVVLIKASGMDGSAANESENLGHAISSDALHIAFSMGGGFGVAGVGRNSPASDSSIFGQSESERQMLCSVFQVLGALWSQNQGLREELDRVKSLSDWLRLEMIRQISDARWEAVAAREELSSSLSNAQETGSQRANQFQTELRRRGEAAHSLGLDLPRITRLDIAIGAVVAETPTEILDNFLVTADVSLIRTSPLGSGRIYITRGKETAVRETYAGQTNLRIIPSDSSNFAEAHNSMMERAFSEGIGIYVLADPHLAFHPDAILAMIRMVRAAGGMVLVEAANPGEVRQELVDPVTFAIPSASEPCVAIPRQLYDSIGGFAGDRVSPADVLSDYSQRALAKGFAVKLCPHAVVIPTSPVVLPKKTVVGMDEEGSIPQDHLDPSYKTRYQVAELLQRLGQAQAGRPAGLANKPSQPGPDR